MVGLAETPSWAFVYFWFTTLAYTICSTELGQTLSYLLPNAPAAQLMGVMFAQILALFAGTTVPGAQIPEYLIWLSYISPQRWATEGVIVTQFASDNGMFCNPAGEIVDGVCQTGTLTRVGDYILGDPSQGPLDPGFGLFGGEGGYKYASRWYDWIYVIGFIIFTRVLVVYAALKISFQKR